MKYPIVQAPMGRCVTPEMAAAVANAGGMGTMGVTWSSPNVIQNHIQTLSALTDKDIAFNFCLQFDQDERIQYALDNGVKIISLFYGDPTPYVKRIHDSGAKVISTVGSVADAKRDVQAGVDAICIQGIESGGHSKTDTGGLSLIPAIVDAVGGMPTVAAGGIADGRGLVAALALGAGGIWLGTRFLATQESYIHPDYMRRILSAKHGDTVLTELFNHTWPNAPHRVLRNSTYDMWKKDGCPDNEHRTGTQDIIAHMEGTPVYRYSEFPPLACVTGNTEPMPHYAGQSVGFINDIKSCADVINDIVTESRAILKVLLN